MTKGMERAEAGLARARRCRWAVVGRSTHRDATTAGREAAGSALAAHDDAGLLLVFASSDHDLAQVAAGIATVAGAVPVVGATTAGELDASGPAHGAVLALALGGDGLSFSATAVSAAADPRDAGARAAAAIGDVADAPHRALLLLSDGPNEVQPDVVRGAYSVAGAGVPLVGGLAGHRAHGGRPALLFGGEVLDASVIGVAIGSDAPIGVGVRHGWRPVGEPLLVTRAAPGRVLELDGRPAATVYRERLGGDPAVPVAVEVTLTHPLGMQRRHGEAHARWVDDDGTDDGSLAGVVPAGALVWLMESDAAGVTAATDAAAREALDALGDDAALALIAFDCNARLRVLGEDGARGEVARLAAHAGDAALAGFYTFGEIARTRGTAGFHQQTLVVLALA
jgi:hypothetical protein